MVAFPNSFWLYDLVAVSATTTSAASAASAAVTATTTAAASRLAGLGLVDGQRSSTGLLTVQCFDRCVGLVLGGHLYKPEPFAPAGRAVTDDFRAQHRTVCRQHRFQIRTADVVAKVPNIQLFTHRKLLSMASPTRGFTFRVVNESGRRSGLEGRWTILALRSGLGFPKPGTSLVRRTNRREAYPAHESSQPFSCQDSSAALRPQNPRAAPFQRTGKLVQGDVLQNAQIAPKTVRDKLKTAIPPTLATLPRPGTRTPDPLISSMQTGYAKLLSAQALTTPTDRVLLVWLPDSVQNDPDLTLLGTSWEQLPAAVKTGIIAMVRAVEGR